MARRKWREKGWSKNLRNTKNVPKKGEELSVLSTAEPAYNRLQVNNNFCLLEKKSVMIGVKQ